MPFIGSVERSMASLVVHLDYRILEARHFSDLLKALDRTYREVYVRTWEGFRKDVELYAVEPRGPSSREPRVRRPSLDSLFKDLTRNAPLERLRVESIHTGNSITSAFRAGGRATRGSAALFVAASVLVTAAEVGHLAVSSVSEIFKAPLEQENLQLQNEKLRLEIVEMQQRIDRDHETQRVLFNSMRRFRRLAVSHPQVLSSEVTLSAEDEPAPRDEADKDAGR